MGKKANSCARVTYERARANINEEFNIEILSAKFAFGGDVFQSSENLNDQF